MKNSTSSKRQKVQEQEKSFDDIDHDDDDTNSSILLPRLPNHLAHRCLSAVHPSFLYGVSRSWRRLIYSPSFPPFYSLYTLLSPTSSSSSTSSSIEFSCFDPISSTWRRLPAPPPEPPLRVLHRHPSFISRILPIQSLAVAGRLVLIAGTTHQFLPAMNRPLCFDPSSSKWFVGPPFTTPRRWCAAGSVHGRVYVASGVGARYQGDVARMLEKWDVKEKADVWKWEKLSSLKDGRFCRESIGAVGYKGKLCMVNVKGNAVKQGAVYNVTKDEWEEMPKGMLAGWNGPAAVAEEAAGDEDEIYTVDEANGSLSRYQPESDSWEEVIKSPEYLKGAEQIVVERGRVCAVSGNGRWVTVVDVTVRPATIWVVNPPPEMEFISVHILPRMVMTTNIEN